MKSMKYLFIAMLLLLTATAANAQFANQPPGSSVIVECPMVSASACGLQDIYNSLEPGNETSPNMASPTSTLTSILRANQASGGSQVEKYFNTSSDMYVSITFRTSNPFPSFTWCANKMWFMRGPGTNGFFGLNKGSGSATIYFGHNTGGGLDNSHVCGGDLGLLGCTQNVNSKPIVFGEFHTIEVYMKTSTTSTSRDGILRVWNNNVKIMEYTNLNYPGGFNNWMWTETYGGPTAPQDRAFVIDHLRVAVPNCTNCGGGGTVVPQPTILNKPTNLRFL